MATKEYEQALRENADRWVPACGGHEEPFVTRTGLRVLYCWNPRTGRHAYIDLGTDMELPAYALAAAGLR